MKGLSIGLICMLLWGCAGGSKQTSVQRIDPSLGRSALADGGIAILPAVIGRAAEPYKLALADSLSAYLADRRTDIPVTKSAESGRVIESQGLKEAVLRAVGEYPETKALDKDLLAKLGQTLNRRYILALGLDGIHEGTRPNQTRLTKWINRTVTTTITYQADAFAQVWDATTGNPVWEVQTKSSSEVTVYGEATPGAGRKTGPYRSIKMAAEEMVHKLP